MLWMSLISICPPCLTLFLFFIRMEEFARELSWGTDYKNEYYSVSSWFFHKFFNHKNSDKISYDIKNTPCRVCFLIYRKQCLFRLLHYFFFVFKLKIISYVVQHCILKVIVYKRIFNNIRIHLYDFVLVFFFHQTVYSFSNKKRNFQSLHHFLKLVSRYITSIRPRLVKIFANLVPQDALYIKCFLFF